MRMRDRVVIGWLDPGHVDGMFALTIANVNSERRDRVHALIRVEAGGLLSRGRNELVAKFMRDTDAEWLLMIDSDEQLSLEAFDKLVDTAHDKDRPIVAGLYFGAWPGEYYPTAMPLIFYKGDGTKFTPVVDYPTDEVLEIDSAGTGCLLIHRSVFEAFRQVADKQHMGEDWCWFMDMPVNGDWFSEDHYFCSRAQTLGFKIHAHTGATLPHRKRFWLAEKHHRPKQTTSMPRGSFEKR